MAWYWHSGFRNKLSRDTTQLAASLGGDLMFEANKILFCLIASYNSELKFYSMWCSKCFSVYASRVNYVKSFS